MLKELFEILIDLSKLIFILALLTCLLLSLFYRFTDKIILTPKITKYINVIADIAVLFTIGKFLIIKF